MCGRLDHYLQLFGNLTPKTSTQNRTELTTCSCPNKPFLLLSVLDHIAAGDITRNFIEPGFKLAETYRSYMKLFPQIPYTIALPLYHLQSAGFWTLKPRPNQQPLPNAPPTLDQFKEAFFGVELDQELFVLLQMPGSRDKLREVLINTSFPDEIRQTIRDQIQP